LHFRHKFLIGDMTAERVKQDYVAQRQTRPGAAGTMAVKGRSLTSGMPTTIDISLKELDTVVGRHVGEIVEVVLDVLGGTSPELSQDIHNHGIVLTGGSAVVPLIRSMLEDATGLRVVAADTPAQCVPNGLHQMLLH